MKSRTIRYRLTQLLVILFFSQIFLLGTLAVIFDHKVKKNIENKIIEKIQFIKPSLMDDLIFQIISNNENAKNILLYYMTKEEQLDSAAIFVSRHEIDSYLSPNNMSHCQISQVESVVCVLNNKLVSIIPLVHSSKFYGYLVKGVDRIKYTRPFKMDYLFYVSISLLTVLLINILGVRFYFKNFVSVDIKRILSFIESADQNDNASINVNFYCTEHDTIYKKFREHFHKIKESEHYRIRAEKQEHLIKISSQVAHDIRSPLAALNIVTQDLRELPEEQRILIRSAVQRIDDIANDLATKKNQDKETKDQKEESYQAHLLSGIIESIVSEKRSQFRSRSGLLIESKLNKDSYGLFAKIKAIEFKRVLSNLINNAVEAIEGKGEIAVTLKSQASSSGPDGSSPGFISIIVSDNGKGIPADVLPKLMKKGASFGKNDSGLGLFHAYETIKSFHGEIGIKSEVGNGTNVTITLPIVDAPDWFLSELVISKPDQGNHPKEITSPLLKVRARHDTKIIILDDDDSIHQIWLNRFSKLNVKKENFFNFKTSESLLKWYFDTALIYEHHEKLFLCDYELLGSEKSGLDIIEELGIAKNAVLITSHFEDTEIRNRSQQLGVKLIPKNLAGYVPITVNGSQHLTEKPLTSAVLNQKNKDNDQPQCIHYDAILIDDDTMIHALWELEAERLQKNIKTFSSADGFFDVIESLNKDTKIYVDSNLGEKIRGEEVSKEIHNKGFKRIYITTGYEKNNFPEMPWISDVVGKSPPFE